MQSAASTVCGVGFDFPMSVVCALPLPRRALVSSSMLHAAVVQRAVRVSPLCSALLRCLRAMCVRSVLARLGHARPTQRARPEYLPTVAAAAN